MLTFISLPLQAWHFICDEVDSYRLEASTREQNSHPSAHTVLEVIMFA